MHRFWSHYCVCIWQDVSFGWSTLDQKIAWHLTRPSHFQCIIISYRLSKSASYISRDSWVVFLLLLCSLMMCANDRVHYGPMVVCLHITLAHYHHYADVCESCIRFTHFYMMFVRITVCYLNITIKSEGWPICHCLGLGHETINCTVCFLHSYRSTMIMTWMNFNHSFTWDMITHPCLIWWRFE